MDDLSALRAWLLLPYLSTFTHAQLLLLLAQCESPNELLTADEVVLAGLLPEQRQEIQQLQIDKHHVAYDEVQRDIDSIMTLGIQVITLKSPLYPMALRELARPPLMLFVRGNVDVLRSTQIAVVGARKASKLAQQVAFNWSSELARQGLVVTSGLALGTDGAAHRGALHAEGKTIAVVAHGLNFMYPPQHKELAEDIMHQGALVSEFSPRVPIRREFFPRRNRIISGLSAGVLVVEAALKSGSLITARYALEQNRDVFAVPGSVNNVMVKGCHQLIKEGAYLVDSVDDIFDAMNWQQARQQSLFGAPPAQNHQASKLLEHISFDLAHIDELVQATGMPVADLGGELMLLEAEGYIETIGGNYRRIR